MTSFPSASFGSVFLQVALQMKVQTLALPKAEGFTGGHSHMTRAGLSQRKPKIRRKSQQIQEERKTDYFQRKSSLIGN
jgi:hypothetical protein